MQYYKPLAPSAALEKFSVINSNPVNIYHTGFEWAMDFLPNVVNTKTLDEFTDAKEEAAKMVLELGHALLAERWLYTMPDNDAYNRVILGIDETTGAELLIVRWNNKSTPIHGHDGGYMIDALLYGSVKEIDYQVIDPIKRTVRQTHETGYNSSGGPIILVNGYYAESEITADAFIHKTIAQGKVITLHLVPAHPRDGMGNVFTEHNKILQL